MAYQDHDRIFQKFKKIDFKYLLMKSPALFRLCSGLNIFSAFLTDIDNSDSKTSSKPIALQ